MDVPTTLKLARSHIPKEPEEDADGATKRFKDRKRKEFLRSLSIDVEDLEKHIAKIGQTSHPKAPLLRAMLSGNLWSVDQLHKAKLCTTNVCFLCGKEIGTFHHTTWVCPMLESRREADQRVQTSKVFHRHLPDVLKEHGWAPKMSADPTTPFWGTKAKGVSEELRITEHGALCIHYIRKRWPIVAAAFENWLP